MKKIVSSIFLSSIVFLGSISMSHATFLENFQNAVSAASKNVVDNVADTGLRHWTAVAAFDFKNDQWLAGAVTDLAIIPNYGIHFDFGYAQPIDHAANARGSVLGGVSIHVDETKVYSEAKNYLAEVAPFIPQSAVGLLGYTTFGMSFGYDFDRSIANGSQYSFVDSSFYAAFVGLEKKFGS